MTNSCAQNAADANPNRQWAILWIGRLAMPALLTFIVVKLVLLFALALNTAFVMDEYWMAAHGLFRLNDLYREIWPSKTVLYAAFFQIPHLLAGDGDSVRIMLVARSQQAVLALAGLALIYGIARNIGRSRLEALFAVAVVLAFAGYIEWIFVVRPEPIALVFGLAGLWCITRRPRGERDMAGSMSLAGTGPVFVAGVLAGLAFLTQQKAVFLNLALGLALVGDALIRRRPMRGLQDGMVLVLGWSLVVGAYYLFFITQGAEPSRMFGQTLAGTALHNALDGYRAYEGGLRHFVPWMLLRDPALYTLCLAGLVLRGRHLASLESAERRGWIFTIVMVALVFTHRSPWPYNFVLAIPMLGLWVTPLRAAAPVVQGSLKPALAAVVVLVFGITFVRNAQTLTHDNAFQNKTARRAESLLGPGDTYFDGIGMLVGRRQAGGRLPGQVVSWDAPVIKALETASTRGDVSHFERIAADTPKVWILSYRTLALKELIAPYLDKAYVAIYPNVLVAGRALDGNGLSEFHVRWPGRYRLYDAAGRPSDAPFEVDGVVTRGTLTLGVGVHLIQPRTQEAPLYLLPADISGVPFDMTRDRSQKPLFQNVYMF